MTRFSGPTRRQILQGGAGVLAAGAMSDPRCALAADKTLTIAIPNNPGTFDPMNQVNHDAMVGTQTVFENLLEVDVDGVLRPSLAVSLPKISDDKLTYWFDLRDDVRFQNGDRFTAEDVKYSYEYIIDPKNKAVRRNLWTPIREITVESPTRVRFEMRMPYRPWLDYMSKFMGIFPKGSREKFGSDYFRLTPIGVGTGPGIFVEWRQNDYVEFRRNPDYWRKGVPAWDRLVMKTVPEDSVRVAYLPDEPGADRQRAVSQGVSPAQVVAGHNGRQQARPGLQLLHAAEHQEAPLRRREFPQGDRVRDRPQAPGQGRLLRDARRQQRAGAAGQLVVQQGSSRHDHL